MDICIRCCKDFLNIYTHSIKVRENSSGSNFEIFFIFHRAALFGLFSTYRNKSIVGRMV
jgi:hypothetical protein